ncbi:MAG: class I SAM-dependent methyltransferase [Candidatus Izemoplasmatales bacterium]|nr:class I SAM-dependent methyltransferase [Candidatus Izemoplasmatales bacterium]
MKSIRLLAASKYVIGYNCLADCGTDHAKLPIYCVENNFVKKAYASDNKIGPLENAIKSINAVNLEGKVFPVLADGLGYLISEIDVVSILGMGGRLIQTILEQADLKDVKRLILIANSENFILRDYLEKNNWKIDIEELIKEKGKYYQLMVLSKGSMNLSEIEKEFGPLIIKEKSEAFVEMIDKNIKKLLKAKQHAKSTDVILKIEVRLHLLKEVIS